MYKKSIAVSLAAVLALGGCAGMSEREVATAQGAESEPV